MHCISLKQNIRAAMTRQWYCGCNDRPKTKNSSEAPGQITLALPNCFYQIADSEKGGEFVRKVLPWLKYANLYRKCKVSGLTLRVGSDKMELQKIPCRKARGIGAADFSRKMENRYDVKTYQDVTPITELKKRCEGAAVAYQHHESLVSNGIWYLLCAAVGAVIALWAAK